MKKKFSVEQFVSSLAESVNGVREPTEADLAKGVANTTIRLDPVDRAFIEGEAAHFGISIQQFLAMVVKGLRQNRLTATKERNKRIVFGIQHNYQRKDNGEYYTRYLCGHTSHAEVDHICASLQIIYEDMVWRGEGYEAVFVDLATDFLIKEYGFNEISSRSEINNNLVSFIIDLHWNWEQVVCDWNLRDEIKKYVTPTAIFSLVSLLDKPYNPLSSFRRLEVQLIANGVIPFRCSQYQEFFYLDDLANASEYPLKSSLAKKMREIREAETSGRAEFAQLIGFNKKTIENIELTGRAPKGEMLEAVCQQWPKYTLWLMTGEIDKASGQTSPKGGRLKRIKVIDGWKAEYGAEEVESWVSVRRII